VIAFFVGQMIDPCKNVKNASNHCHWEHPGRENDGTRRNAPDCSIGETQLSYDERGIWVLDAEYRFGCITRLDHLAQARY
jgi:hypothetical protein